MLPRQLVRQQRAQQSAKVNSIPAPVGGWNARDSVDQMPESDAVILDNFFPDEGEVRLRKGSSQYISGLGGNVEMLAEYHAAATQKFLAAANGKIFDITNSGTAAQLASGMASNRWQWKNFNGTLGLVNGSDAPRKYAGSAISTLSITASAAATVASFIGIQSYKSRTYFWQDDSQDFYYSAINALGGTLTRFPLSRVGQFGGNLLTMETWSRDAGDGMDDLAVFIMTSGEVVVYQGSNPGDASDWALVGIYRLSRPISINGAVNLGGDLIIATEQGYFPLSSAFQGRVTTTLSDKISRAVLSAAQNYGTNYGWQAIYYPKAHWLIFNVPVTTNNTYVQHVMNTVTGAWCRFEGMNARVWGLYNGDLYFGGNGEVLKANDGATDNGNDIEAEGQPAYNYLRSRATRKALSGIQPVFSTDGNLNFDISIGMDFRSPSQPAPTRTAGTSGATWDSATWDVAEWSGGLFVVNDWRLISGVGFNVGFRLAIKTNNVNVRWFATQIMYRNAGVT